MEKSESKEDGSYRSEPMYGAIIVARTNAISLHWQRYNTMAVINLGFITAMLARFGGENGQSTIGEFPIQSVWIGLGIATVWLGKIRVGRFWISEVWEKRASEYELKILRIQNSIDKSLLPISNNKSLIEGNGTYRKKRLRRNWWNFNFCAVALPAFCTVWWSYVALCNSSSQLFIALIPIVCLGGVAGFLAYKLLTAKHA